MSSNRLTTPALLGALLALGPTAAAQDRPFRARPEPARTEHAVYVVRNADAAALARSLADLGDVRLSPVPGTDALVVSGPAGATAGVVKLLEQLDRQPKTVAVEVTLAEISLRKGEKDKDAPEPVLAGPTADVAAKLDELARAGQATVQRFRLTSVEGQPATTTAGGNKPVTTSVAGFGGGGGFGGRGGGGGQPAVQRSVTYHSVGTTVKATARAGADNAVVIELDVHDSRLKPTDAADETAAAAMDSSTLSTKVNVPAGRTVVAQAVSADGKAGRRLSVVVVSARVTDPGAVASK